MRFYHGWREVEMTPPRVLHCWATRLAGLCPPLRHRAAWWRRPPHGACAVDAWITREFVVRGLAPPHCTPTALARALERERQITILFQPHASNDPGVYGLLRRPVESPHLAIILFRPTYSLTLRCLILFHELAHLLFDHPVPAAPCRGARGAWGARRHEAIAEAFAVGAMQYALHAGAPGAPGAASADDVSASAFGQLLRRTQYRPCQAKGS